MSYLHGNNPGRTYAGVHAVGSVLYDWLDVFVVTGCILFANWVWIEVAVSE
jgi:hypothetical protein